MASGTYTHMHIFTHESDFKRPDARRLQHAPGLKTKLLDMQVGRRTQNEQTRPTCSGFVILNVKPL